MRVYDVLGAGGFLVTNYQADFIENGFLPGEDLIVYESKQDLISKVDYFLTHEKERVQITENGKRKIAMMHTYDNRIKEILEIVREGK